MNKPRVLNKRRLDGINLFDCVYVGRPTKWGNPFEIGKPYGNVSAMTREQVIEQYRDWLLGSDQGMKLLKNIGELRGKSLICWCAPLTCHADVLMEIANA